MRVWVLQSRQYEGLGSLDNMRIWVQWLSTFPPGRGRDPLVAGLLALPHLVHPGAAVVAVSPGDEASVLVHPGLHVEPCGGRHTAVNHQNQSEGSAGLSCFSIAGPGWRGGGAFVLHVTSTETII